MFTTEEKLDFIIKQAEKHEISAYEFWKEGGISQMSAHNILTQKHKTPRNKTLNKMLA